ncbi:MAG: hypothetical protein J6X49_14395 [Victivallales bacterium]|nr:hypothetical protein [Victivallales bacterium]
MQFKTLIRPEHLNHNGHLFGGYMLLWVDEYAYIADMEDYPGARFVTRAMDSVSFTESVSNGDVITFEINRLKTGHTSVTYSVDVTALGVPTGIRRDVFHTNVTFCNTDGNGSKALLPTLKQQS